VIEQEILELEEVSKKAGNLSSEIDNFLYRLKPDQLLMRLGNQ